MPAFSAAAIRCCTANSRFLSLVAGAEGSCFKFLIRRDDGLLCDPVELLHFHLGDLQVHRRLRYRTPKAAAVGSTAADQPREI